jgi:signal transduction histidine kinase
MSGGLPGARLVGGAGGAGSTPAEPPVRRDRRAAWRPRFIILAAALLGNGIAVAIVLGSEHPTDARTLAILIGVSWSFVVSGLVAAARQSLRFGSLMCAVGLSVNLAALPDSESSILFSAGVLVGSVWIAVFIHALLAFPTGRLPSRGAAWIAAAAYAVLTLGQLAVFLFDDLADECPECPDHAFLIEANDATAAALDATVSAIGALVALAIIVELAGRWRSASPPLRRALAPVLATGGAAIVLLAGMYASYTISQGLYDVLGWILLALLAAFPFAFLLGLLRMRLARSAVGRLVVELGATSAEAELRDALRRALHDPGLTLAYWQPGLSAFVDNSGRPVALPEAGSDRTASVIERNGEPVAALIHDEAIGLDPELIEAVAAAAGLTLENERLQAELRARLDDLRASRARIVEAEATERRRLERDLHDGAQQRLVALALQLRMAEGRADADPTAGRQALGDASAELGRAIEELREIARGIHPALLSDRGLGPALEGLAARTPMVVTVELELGEDVRFPQAIEVAAYYVAAEALTNVVKYAQAKEATVRVERGADRAILQVADDGVGGADPERGSGLRGLVDRVEALDGTLELSSPPGRGTRIRAEFPLRGAPGPVSPSHRTQRAAGAASASS